MYGAMKADLSSTIIGKNNMSNDLASFGYLYEIGVVMQKKELCYVIDKNRNNIDRMIVCEILVCK